MILIPAIDLYKGRCVRLFQGKFDQITYFDIDPDTLAKRYSIAGASWLHVVSLDGAEGERRPDFAQIRNLCQISNLNIQCGGGLRDPELIQQALQVGVKRAVVGSMVLSDPALLKTVIHDYGAERITLALDIRITNDEPKLASHGWTQQSEISLWDVLDEYATLGIHDVLCTDISKDGAMSGPNFSLYRECATRFPKIAFQASGGVRDVNDLDQLATTGVSGAIVGRALYQNSSLLEESRPFLPNA